MTTSRQPSALRATPFPPETPAATVVAPFVRERAAPQSPAPMPREPAAGPRVGAAGEPPLRVMVEMRPALDGFAGIPQETRLLFRGLCLVDGVEVEGLLQSPNRILSAGEPTKRRRFARTQTAARRYNRASRVVVSLQEKPYRNALDKAANWLERKLAAASLTVSGAAGLGRIRLTRFEAEAFEDFTWRSMFAKTLPASDRALVARRNHRICATPWSVMHRAGLNSLTVSRWPSYPRLRTDDVGVFIAQTPYPGRVSRGTSLVVRYHDAIPVFMPHTIPDKSAHQATHFYALLDNVRQGAWFACVSEATRADLLRLHPEVEDRAVTIHNMVSHHYHDRPAARALVPGIVRARLNRNTESKGVGFRLLPEFLTLREQEAFYGRHLRPDMRYLLVVSTIEPRKNHARLVAAWEVLKAEVDPDLKLVVVGTIGWDFKPILEGLRSWIDRGDVFMLEQVPAPDLRVLYQHAAATVCPSLGEGFDFSGVEAMASGGVTLASDIPVHREVYEDAAEYFDPYSTQSLVEALRRVVYGGEQGPEPWLRARGAEVAARYQPGLILPRWARFLERVRASTPAREPRR